MRRRSPGVMLALFVVVVLGTVGLFGGCTPASWGAWHTSMYGHNAAIDAQLEGAW